MSIQYYDYAEDVVDDHERVSIDYCRKPAVGYLKAINVQIPLCIDCVNDLVEALTHASEITRCGQCTHFMRGGRYSDYGSCLRQAKEYHYELTEDAYGVHYRVHQNDSCEHACIKSTQPEIDDDSVWIVADCNIQPIISPLPDGCVIAFDRYVHKNDKTRYSFRIKIYEGGKLKYNLNHTSQLVLPIYVRKNDNDYIIASGDSMSITVVNLTTGVIKSYTDEDPCNIKDPFIPISMSWNKFYDTLIIDGCFKSNKTSVETIRFRVSDLDAPIFDWERIYIDRKQRRVLI